MSPHDENNVGIISRLVRSDELAREEIERQIAETGRAVDAIADEDIDLSDMPETTPEQWKTAIPNPFYRPVEEQVTLQIDRYILGWFRQNHDTYLTAINAALMEHIWRERATKIDE